MAFEQSLYIPWQAAGTGAPSTTHTSWGDIYGAQDRGQLAGLLGLTGEYAEDLPLFDPLTFSAMNPNDPQYREMIQGSQQGYKPSLMQAALASSGTGTQYTESGQSLTRGTPLQSLLTAGTTPEYMKGMEGVYGAIS